MNDCHVAHNKCHLSTFRHVTNFFKSDYLKSGGFLLPEGKSRKGLLHLVCFHAEFWLFLDKNYSGSCSPVASCHSRLIIVLLSLFTPTVDWESFFSRDIGWEGVAGNMDLYERFN